jgi:hypothetical protein
VDRAVRGDVFALALAALLASDTAAAGAEPRAQHWLVQLAGGVNSMQLDDVKDFYNGVLDSYRAQGVPVESQRDFPPNLALGGDVVHRWNNGWGLGLGSRYTWTHGYSQYADPGGTLDVTTRMGLTTLALVLQKAWQPSPAWSTFVELRSGKGFVTIEETETIVLSGTVTGTSEAKLEGNGNAPLGELHVGGAREFGRNAVYGSLGYRYCKVPGPPFDLDVSGVVFTVGFSRWIR